MARKSSFTIRERKSAFGVLTPREGERACVWSDGTYAKFKRDRGYKLPNRYWRSEGTNISCTRIHS